MFGSGEQQETGVQIEDADLPSLLCCLLSAVPCLTAALSEV
jgi:hypothetical protein